MPRLAGNKVIGLALMIASSVGLSVVLEIWPLGALMILLGFVGLCLYAEEMHQESVREMNVNFGNLKVLLRSLKYKAEETGEAQQKQAEPEQ